MITKVWVKGLKKIYWTTEKKLMEKLYGSNLLLTAGFGMRYV